MSSALKEHSGEKRNEYLNSTERPLYMYFGKLGGRAHDRH